MGGLYSGMSVGFGFLLICALLFFVWIVFQNLKKRMLPQNRSVDVVDFVNCLVEEKRKEKRVDIIWPVSIETNKGILKAETKGLSLSGAFIKCSKPLLSGEQFVLTIETPFKGPIPLKSVVIWSNSNIPEEKVVTRGMGIRFIQNKGENTELLKSALKKYLEEKDISPSHHSTFI